MVPKIKYPYCSQNVGGLLKKIVPGGHKYGDIPLRLSLIHISHSCNSRSHGTKPVEHSKAAGNDANDATCHYTYYAVSYTHLDVYKRQKLYLI